MKERLHPMIDFHKAYKSRISLPPSSYNYLTTVMTNQHLQKLEAEKFVTARLQTWPQLVY